MAAEDTTTQIEVDDLEELRALPATLHELSIQAREIVEYAGTWVCATDGFQPSPVCVLRPLVPVLTRLEEAFDELGRELVGECGRLAAGLEVTHAELVGSERAAVAELGVPQRALDRVPGRVA